MSMSRVCILCITGLAALAIGFMRVGEPGAETQVELVDRTSAVASVVATLAPGADATTGEAWLSAAGDCVYVLDWQEGTYHLSTLGRSDRTFERVPLKVPESVFMPDEVQTAVDGSGRMWLAAGHVFGYAQIGSASFTSIALPETIYPLDTASVRGPNDRQGRITGMALGPDGRIWLTRAGVHSVLEFQIESAKWIEHEAPATLECPEKPSVLGERLVVVDSARSASEFEKSTAHSLDVQNFGWTSFPLPGPVLGSNGESLVVALDGDQSLAIIGADGSERHFVLPDLDPRLINQVTLTPEDGVWSFTNDGAVVLVNSDNRTGTQADLPASQVLYLPHRHPGAAAAEIPVTIAATARPTSCAVSTLGDLWFVYRTQTSWAIATVIVGD